MKKLFFLAIVLYVFASCSAETNDPIVEKTAITADYTFSHITDSGEVYVSDANGNAATEIRCPNCGGNNWAILNKDPLIMRCNICDTWVEIP